MLPTRALFPHPWPLLSLVCVLSFSATNRLAHRSFPTRSLTSAIKKNNKISFLWISYMHTQAHSPCPAPALRMRSHTLVFCTHQTLRILGPQVTGVITTLFSQWQARKDDRTCVCSQKTGLNWFRAGKIELCVFFFFSCL